MMPSMTQRTIGVDLGDKHSNFCELDETGAVLEEGRFPTTAAGVKRRFEHLPPTRIALETGTHSPWVARLLLACGHEVLVANPRKLRLIYQNDKKSDRVDAESLARLARVDPHLLAPIHRRSLETQRDLAALRARSALVRARTQLVNHLRGAVKAFGGRLPKCSTPTFHIRAAAHLPAELATALEPLLRMLAQLSTELRAWDKRITREMTTAYPETARLAQVPGVGPITALTYRLTIEDPQRFATSRIVGSYLGLRPRRRASGLQDRQLRITKGGDSDLRRLLVGCAQYILGPFGPDSDLRRWGLALATHGGKSAKQRAVVAVARKLAVLLHRLWVTGAPYEPRRHCSISSAPVVG